MCGIMAYIGKKEAYPILINGLKKLEYRGYDSSGVAIMNGSLSVLKKTGKVSALEAFALNKKTDGNIGLGHTRWATHGVPSDINAHPHRSQCGRYTIVHNGIIENYLELKKVLLKAGYEFQSETDTEVLVQLISWIQNMYQLSTRAALLRALELVTGSFAVTLFDLYNPTKLWAARSQSPLVIGLGEEECFLSSDTLPFTNAVKEVIYLEDQMAIEMNDEGEFQCYDLLEQKVEPVIQDFKPESSASSMGKYGSYMLKEIHDQASSVQRLIDNYKKIKLEKPFKRIIITACGTSLHSGLLGAYLIEKIARIPARVECASEFRYRNPVLDSSDLVIAISQSGETADTIAALELAKTNGCQTIGMVNMNKSTIARMVDQVIDLQAGIEIGVASTKAFTNQVTSLILLLAQLVEDSNGVLANEIHKLLAQVPHLIDEVLESVNDAELSRYLSQFKSAIYLGRGAMYPIALEGALKLKELSYIHAEGYAGGEMKHGPLALIDESMPIIALCNDDHQLPKMISNIQEAKARNGRIIIIKNQSITLPEGIADYVIEVPDCNELISPIIQNVPLQILAYEISTCLGRDVDKPRNLAKSVTVE